MRTYILTIAASLLLIAGFNLWIDPASWWHRAPPPFEGPLPDGMVRIFPVNFDQRQMKVSQLKTAPEADLILMGSSRGMLVDQQMLNPAIHLRNLAVSTAMISEFAAFWQAVLERGRAPKYVVIFMDPWLFNANADLGDPGWLHKTGYLSRFLGSSGHPATMRNQFEETVQLLKSTALRGIELFTWPTLLASLNSVSKFGVGGELQKSAIVAETQMPNGVVAYRGDGSYVYPRDFSRDITQQQVDQLAASEPKTENDFKYAHYQRTGNEQELLVAMARGVLAAGSKLLLISPPLHRLTYERMLGLEDFARILSDFRQALAEVQRLEPHLSVCDLTDAVAAGCQQSEFSDGLHMTASCAAKVLRKCFLATPGWENAVPSHPLPR